MAATFVWGSDGGACRATRTSIVLAAWPEVPAGDSWHAKGQWVYRQGERVLEAETAEAAHAIAVSVAGAGDVSLPSDPFAVHGVVVLAGADVLGRAVDPPTARLIAGRLSGHCRAGVLGAGLAVAADPTVGAYQIDPTWQMRNGPEPWTERVQQAALSAGAVIIVNGTLESWRWAGHYRHVECDGAWDGARLDIRVGPVPVAGPDADRRSPLAALVAAMDVIDALGDDRLFQIGLAAPWPSV